MTSWHRSCGRACYKVPQWWLIKPIKFIDIYTITYHRIIKIINHRYHLNHRIPPMIDITYHKHPWSINHRIHLVMFTNFANQSTTLYRSNKVTIPDSFCQSVLGGGFMPHLGHRPQFRKKKAGVHNSGKFILLKNRGVGSGLAIV